jgi:hypothetical protein
VTTDLVKIEADDLTGKVPDELLAQLRGEVF